MKKVFRILTIILLIVFVIILFNLVENIYESFQSDPKIDTLLIKIKPLFDRSIHSFKNKLEPLNKRDILKEIKILKGNKSYTINKQKIYLCLKDKDGRYYNDNNLLFVLLHEISHSICDEIGHTEKFYQIFNELLEHASINGVYDTSIPMISDYCDYEE